MKTNDVRGLFDLPSAMRRVGDDRQLVADLAVIYLEDLPEIRGQIASALDDRNGSVLSRHIHSLKGLAANFGASRLVALAQRLEAEARDGEFDQVRTMLSQLHALADELSDELRDFLAST